MLLSSFDCSDKAVIWTWIYISKITWYPFKSVHVWECWCVSIKGLTFAYVLLGSAQSTERIGELLQEDKNAKSRRELCQKQSTLLSKLIRQLGVHDNRAAAATTWSNDAVEPGNDGCRAVHIFSFLCLCYTFACWFWGMCKGGRSSISVLMLKAVEHYSLVHND